jgi:hypothetical protein
MRNSQLIDFSKVRGNELVLTTAGLLIMKEMQSMMNILVNRGKDLSTHEMHIMKLNIGWVKQLKDDVKNEVLSKNFHKNVNMLENLANNLRGLVEPAVVSKSRKKKFLMKRSKTRAI